MTDEMTFTKLGDYTAVDINPETADTYRTELEYVAQTSGVDLTVQYGRFLVVTPDGPDVLQPHEFHEKWAFYTPTRADRTQLRTIVLR